MQLFLRSYFELTRFEFFLQRGRFAALREHVRRVPIRELASSQGEVDRICRAMDHACIWYWHEVLCLQRSAATTCLLKKYGVRAELIIGAQQVPFRSHAWVEIDGNVVNDKPYVAEVFPILDRC
jgi:hypothetical protein